ncbi:hypothetical protein SDC9_60092 [bioreactor metagenome]|uniref:Uncharacterized protein n=1 Tax=bioreactor metagenome TaxID=1076179 RepID=A0A644XHS7_9ZZZZ
MFLHRVCHGFSGMNTPEFTVDLCGSGLLIFCFIICSHRFCSEKKCVAKPETFLSSQWFWYLFYHRHGLSTDTILTKRNQTRLTSCFCSPILIRIMKNTNWECRRLWIVCSAQKPGQLLTPMLTLLLLPKAYCRKECLKMSLILP